MKQGTAIAPSRSAKTTIKIELASYVIIEGAPVFLPSEAKFVAQDKHGIWFYFTKRPRPSPEGWPAQKTPIQLKDKEGRYLPKLLITPIKSKGWERSVQSTIEKEIEAA